jgi:hypothetical protein
VKRHAAIHTEQDPALRSILILGLFDDRSRPCRITRKKTLFDEEVTIDRRAAACQEGQAEEKTE